MFSEKKGEIEFGWIFSIIVGAVVLFLAFYFIGTNMSQKRAEQETIEAQNFDAMLNQFGYLGNISSIQKMVLTLSDKSEITIGCEESGVIGYDSIETAKAGKGAGTGITRNVYDKYIYADISGVEVKNIQPFGVSFNAPWRVADLIMLWPYEKKYCIAKGAPQEMRDRMRAANISNIIVENESSCPDESATIGSSCSGGYDINICQESGYVEKNGAKLYYSGELVYAAIFSEPALYYCNLYRIGKRLGLQAELYEDKAETMGCQANFEQIKSAAKRLEASGSPTVFEELRSAEAAIEAINENCALY